ncbi:hypothetical protein BGZ73_004842 [Actinomortierella ambigua]|nr:hypothetical protein BGZ73_004842 [Actinomortierella ambigua]
MNRIAKPRTTTGENLVGLWRPSFTRVDQKLYQFGGGGHVTNDMHVLDLETLRWERVPAKEGVPPTKRFGHTAVLWKDNIIVFGGSNEFQEYCHDVVVFSLKNRTWYRPEIRGEVPARYLHSATVYKNCMYVYGGFAKASDCTYVLEELRILNLDTWTWSGPHTVPARYNHSASLVGSKLWIYAGKDENGHNVSDLHSLDLDTLKILPHVGITGKVVLLKSQHFSEVIGNQLVVFGRGLNDNNGSGVYGLWMLDLDQLEWRKIDIDKCLADGVWNYFTITTKQRHTSDSTALVSRSRISSHADGNYGSSYSSSGGGSGSGGHRDRWRPESDPMWLDDATESQWSPSLIFLGNTEKERPQQYDHFRDVLSIDVEYLGLFQVPQPNLQLQFGMMLNNPEFSDFTIQSKSSPQKIHVHRMVLTTRWPHFRNLHASGMLESTRGTMVLPEPYQVIYAFLYYLYTDTLDPDLDHTILCEILVMANMYLLERLRKLAAATLHERHLNVDTCVRIFQAACLAQERGLKRLSHEFILRHCGAVMKTEGWLILWGGGGSQPVHHQQHTSLHHLNGGGGGASTTSTIFGGSRPTSTHAGSPGVKDEGTGGGSDFEGRTEAMSPSSDMSMMRSVMDEFIEGISDDASLIIAPDRSQGTEGHKSSSLTTGATKK